jgi:hypothetical protein
MVTGTPRWNNTPELNRLTLYCSRCRATSTFVRIEQRGWVCIGDAPTQREGCGKRLQERPQVQPRKFR